MVPALLKYSCAGLAGVLICAILTILIAQRVSDGPVEFLQGGPFKTGEHVEETVAYPGRHFPLP